MTLDEATQDDVNNFCKIIQDKVGYVRDWCLGGHWEIAYDEIDNLQTTIRGLEALVDKWRKEEEKK